MAAVAERSSGRPAASPRDRGGKPPRQHAHPNVSRRAELWIAGIALAISVIILGGFAAVMNQIDEATFDSSVRPALGGLDPDLTSAEAFELGRTLGAWFGFTLLAVLFLGCVGMLIAHRAPWLKRAGWWLAGAGVACLLGSQLILFPLAFLFFVSAALFALRPLPTRSIS